MTTSSTINILGSENIGILVSNLKDVIFNRMKQNKPKPQRPLHFQNFPDTTMADYLQSMKETDKNVTNDILEALTNYMNILKIYIQNQHLHHYLNSICLF